MRCGYMSALIRFPFCVVIVCNSFGKRMEATLKADGGMKNERYKGCRTEKVLDVNQKLSI